MNSFFSPVIVDELTRIPWSAVRHLIPPTIGGSRGADRVPYTPSPQVSGTSSAQSSATTSARTAYSQQLYLQTDAANGGHTLAAANAAAAVALSDLGAVPPPPLTRPMFYKYANHLTDGMCLVVTDSAAANGNGNVFGGLLAPNDAHAPSPVSSSHHAVFNNTVSHTPQQRQRYPYQQEHAPSASVGSHFTLVNDSTERPVRAWVAQLKPEAMLSQLESSFSHVKVGVPHLLKLVEASLLSGQVGFQLLAPSPCAGKGKGGDCSSLPSQLRVFLPISVSVSKESAITLSLTVDAFALEEVVDDRLKATCYPLFVLEMIVQPMVRTQAALVAALTVLASRGSLQMTEFEAVFKHPIVAQKAAEATIGSSPTFWGIVTEAAMPPRPICTPPPPPQTAAGPQSYCTRESVPTMEGSPSSHVTSIGTVQAATATAHTNVTASIVGAVGVKRVSSYVESEEERARKRVLAEALHNKQGKNPTLSNSCANNPSSSAAATAGGPTPPQAMVPVSLSVPSAATAGAAVGRVTRNLGATSGQQPNPAASSSSNPYAAPFVKSVVAPLPAPAPTPSSASVPSASTTSQAATSNADKLKKIRKALM